MTPTEALKHYFGYTEFKAGQKKVIDLLLGHKNTLALLPTGGGKSLCYQIPALLEDGLTLVISPLISLMKDQVDSLQQNGIPAAFINSSQEFETAKAVLAKARRHELKLLYIAPERLENQFFLELLQTLPVSLVAVDEAHCISQWGHDFRPSYLKLPALLAQLPVRPTLVALTATATPQVAKDIKELLLIPAENEVKTSFARDNLTFKLIKGTDFEHYLLSYLKQNPNDSGIIYASTRKRVEQLGIMLNKMGIKAGIYHAGLSELQRRESQEDFLYDRTPVMVATNAFGMGIDKSNVRFVIHAQVPGSLEAYYQEAGRAGRDGLPSEAILFYKDADLQVQRFFIDNSQADEQHREFDYQKLQDLTRYANTEECLQRFLVQYFGQDCPDCQKCTNCTDTREKQDITKETQMIMSCIVRMQSRFGKKIVAQVLAGSKAKRILELSFDQLSTYGIMHQKTKEIETLIDFLTASGYLKTSSGQFPTLHVTQTGLEVLRGQAKVYARIEKAERNSEQPVESGLFEHLRKLRRQLAEAQHVPPFVIFSDQALQDMCVILPTNEMEFLEVKGVGHSKLEKYGTIFLDAIKEYQSASQPG